MGETEEGEERGRCAWEEGGDRKENSFLKPTSFLCRRISRTKYCSVHAENQKGKTESKPRFPRKVRR